MHRITHMIRAGAAARVVSAIVFGCGGSGGGSASTSATSTTGTATSGTSSTTTSGSGTTATTTGSSSQMSLTPATMPEQITQQSQSIGLTLNYSGTPGATFVWSVAGPHSSGNGFVVAPPGSEGTLLTVDGKPFPTTATSLTQAVYVGDPTRFSFGGFDNVIVQTQFSPTTFGPSTRTMIPLVSDWVTLPPAVTSIVISMTTDKPSYKPGDTVTATIVTQPGINNTQFQIDAPLGFTPTNVTVNGNAVTLPFTLKYGTSGGPIQTTATFVIPANQFNEFPVSSSVNGQTGPWLLVGGLGGSGDFGILTPFFIHS